MSLAPGCLAADMVPRVRAARLTVRRLELSDRPEPVQARRIADSGMPETMPGTALQGPKSPPASGSAQTSPTPARCPKVDPARAGRTSAWARPAGGRSTAC
jgi:hypothetical protein